MVRSMRSMAAHGRIDVLANVAGIGDFFLPAHEVDDETWARVLAVNVTGPMLLGRRVLPLMMARKSGSIVNVSSAGGLRGGAAGCAYTTSKHALIGYTRSVAWTYRAGGHPLQRGLPWWRRDEHRHDVVPEEPVGPRAARADPRLRHADGPARRDRRAHLVAGVRRSLERERRGRSRRTAAGPRAEHRANHQGQLTSIHRPRGDRGFRPVKNVPPALAEFNQVRYPSLSEVPTLERRSMATTIGQIDGFLALKRIAVVGVSRNPKEISYTLWQELRQRRYDAVPVNPAATEIDGKRCLRERPRHRSAGRGRADHDHGRGGRAGRRGVRRGRHRPRLAVRRPRRRCQRAPQRSRRPNATGSTPSPATARTCSCRGRPVFHRIHGVGKKLTGSYPKAG